MKYVVLIQCGPVGCSTNVVSIPYSSQLVKSCLHSSLGDDISDELSRANWRYWTDSRSCQLMILYSMSVGCMYYIHVLLFTAYRSTFCTVVKTLPTCTSAITSVISLGWSSM